MIFKHETCRCQSGYDELFLDYKDIRNLQNGERLWAHMKAKMYLMVGYIPRNKKKKGEFSTYPTSAEIKDFYYKKKKEEVLKDIITSTEKLLFPQGPAFTIKDLQDRKNMEDINRIETEKFLVDIRKIRMDFLEAWEKRESELELTLNESKIKRL